MQFEKFNNLIRKSGWSDPLFHATFIGLHFNCCSTAVQLLFNCVQLLLN